MLLTNQRLDKLTAMHSDFAERGMLPAGHNPPRNIMHPQIHKPSRSRGHDSDGKDEGPDEQHVLTSGEVTGLS